MTTRAPLAWVGVLIPGIWLGAAQARPAGLKVLITGFGPFPGVQVNPTGLFAERFRAGKRTSGMVIKGVTLPVEYQAAWTRARSEIATFKPDLILSLGVAAGESGVRLETLARNEDRGGTDAVGRRRNGVILPGGAAVLPTHLPVFKVASALKAAGVPVRLSDDAGGYLCNHLFYRLMEDLGNKKGVQGAFVHVPLWPVDGKPASLTATVETILQAWTDKPALNLQEMSWNQQNAVVE